MWVVDPLRRQARVYRDDGSVTVVEARGTLSGENVLPGLSITLAEIVDD